MKHHQKLTITIALSGTGAATPEINGVQLGYVHKTEKQAAWWVGDTLLGGYAALPRCPRPYVAICDMDCGITKLSRQTYHVTVNGYKLGKGHRTMYMARKAFREFFGFEHEGKLVVSETTPPEGVEFEGATEPTE